MRCESNTATRAIIRYTVYSGSVHTRPVPPLQKLSKRSDCRPCMVLFRRKSCIPLLQFQNKCRLSGLWKSSSIVVKHEHH
ncbi:hypothetical protein L6164_032147 [Bauhinia variegata]|uniref:Uncharacterized protein n=1 Tax=Bauhinia variegata TaxID=167791 RepID=A0ACB9KN57_BAUVA|nr:hypothetical protein L6164_032147 [Bauhinia variegata]